MDAQISAEFAFDVVETNLKLSKRDRNKTVAPSTTQKKFYIEILERLIPALAASAEDSNESGKQRSNPRRHSSLEQVRSKENPPPSGSTSALKTQKYSETNRTNIQLIST
jgi:hypothetical protein